MHPASSAAPPRLGAGAGLGRLAAGREAAAWALTCCGLLMFLGSGWDAQWHAAVGRDSFWTPPHVLMYAGVGLAGLLCLGIVAACTWRVRRGDAALAGRTAGVFGLFRAPLGALLAGFGALAMAVAAPLDDYWHRLYGLDVTIWAPFHVMGISGSLIIGLGTLYLFASALNRRRAAPVLGGWTGAELGFGLRASLLLCALMFLLIPALEEAPFLEVAGLTIATHPPLAALASGAVLALAVAAMERIGAATLVGLGLGLLRLAAELLIPWATALLAEAQGAAYRPGAPAFTVIAAALPAWLPLAGALIDGALLAARRMRGPARPEPRLLLGVLAAALALLSLIEPLWRERQFGGLFAPGQAAVSAGQTAPAVLLASAAVAGLAAALGGWLGIGVGRLLRLVKE